MKADLFDIPGIHIQWPWSELLLSGRKQIETRSYPIPQKYLGKNLAIIETPARGRKNPESPTKSSIVGIIRFEGCFKYDSEAAWKRDKSRHLVDEKDLLFSYDEAKEKWGWVVDYVERLSEPVAPPKKRGIIFASKCRVRLLNDALASLDP